MGLRKTFLSAAVCCGFALISAYTAGLLLADDSDLKADEPAKGQVRTWTDTLGNQIQARLVRVKNGNVVLSRGRKVVPVPFRNLSAEDRQYVRRQTPTVEWAQLMLLLEPVRKWTLADGGEAEARFITVEGKNVVLLLNGGRVYGPFAKLSEDDRDYVRGVLKARGRGHLLRDLRRRRPAVAADPASVEEWRERFEEWLNPSGERSASAAGQVPEETIDRIRNIRDPEAVKPLVNLLAREKDIKLRATCLETLAAIGNKEAVRVLVRISLTDPDLSLRQVAAWEIAGVKDSDRLLTEFAPYVRGENSHFPALSLLYAFGLLQPASSTELPNEALTYALIDRLVGQGIKNVPVERWEGFDAVTPKGYYGEFRYHSYRRWQRRFVPVKVPVRNPIAYETLTRYTGADHEYDRQAWKGWYRKRKEMLE